MIERLRSPPYSDLIGDGDFVVLDEHDAFAQLKTIAVMRKDSATEVGHSLPLLGMLHFKRADHAAMCKYENVGAFIVGMNPIKRSARANEQLVMKFVARWPLVVAEIARPFGFDLGTSETFPLAGIAFHEVGVDDDWADSDLRTDDLGRFKRTNKWRGDNEVDRADALRRMECLLPTKVSERRVSLSLPTANGIPFRLAVADEKQASHGVTVPDPRDRGVAITA